MADAPSKLDQTSDGPIGVGTMIRRLNSAAALHQRAVLAVGNFALTVVLLAESIKAMIPLQGPRWEQ